MARYLAARLCSGILLFVAITFCVFAAFFVVPEGNRNRAGFAPTTEGSLPHRYGEYVWSFLRHGSLGTSTANREPVTGRLVRAIPVTLSLVIGGMIVWLLIAVPLGILAAMRPRSLLERTITIAVLVGVACHPVWLGLTFGWLFGQHLHVVPSTGYCDLFSPTGECGGPGQWSSHLLMPWLVFGLVNAALSTLLVRALVLEELGKEYVVTARAKGAGEARVVRGHVLRNVLAPVVSMAGMTMAIALGGVVFVESAFGLPGLGGMLRRSIQQHDVPTTAGIVIFLALVIMLVNLIVDVVNAALDPRTRVGAASPQRA